MSNIKHKVSRIGQYALFVGYVFHVGQLDECLVLWSWIRRMSSMVGLIRYVSS